MDRKKFLKTGGLAVGLMPFVAMCDKPETASVNAAATNILPKMASPNLNNSYWYRGHLMSVLISAKDTNGAFSLTHGFEIQGLEPPPHTHTREDESFYVMQGEMNFFVGDKTFNAKTGDWVFLPRNIQHTFQVVTPTAEVLINLTPGGFENFFIEMSEPAQALVIPPKPAGPPDVQKIIEISSKYGIKYPKRDS